MSEQESGTRGEMTPPRIAGYIDHTLLKPEATAAQIEQLCQEAAAHRFAAVCVNPTFVALAAKRLAGTPVKTCTVVGFPLGAHLPEIKALEAQRAIEQGAAEIDMVINLGALKGGGDDLVQKDIQTVVDACRASGAVCKVIIECTLLTDEEKIRACRLAQRAGANYVKTSTGFAAGGATAEDVALMSKTVHDAGMGVKAAGGIRTFAEFTRMVKAGATRIGTSSGVKIMAEARG